MIRPLFAALVLLLATPALAAEPEKKPDTGQYVDLSPVALPIVAGGRLVNYVFVYVRLNLASSADPVRLRAKEPYFRDALIRAGHRTPFTRADDYLRVDDVRLRATMMREAAQIAGPRAVRSVVITAQAPRRRVGVPKPAKR